MADYTYVNISLPEAKRLADLYGVAIDLRACRDYCEKYLQVFSNILQPSDETKHLECFSVYIFVKYGRCFKGGVRNKLAEEILASSSGFSVGEFKPPLTIEKLCKAIVADNYDVSIQAPIETINWLNELLAVPNFYDILRTKKPDISFSENITDLVDKTKEYRNKSFSTLNAEEKHNIKRLSRLILEETYPQETPKSLKLSPDDLDIHQRVIEVRDKHIAHSVNDFESHKVRVWLNPEEEGRKIDEVNIESQYLLGPAPKLVKKLKHLVDKLLKWIETEKKREEERLIQIVGRKYTLDKLYSLNGEEPNVIDPSRNKQGRRTP